VSSVLNIRGDLPAASEQQQAGGGKARHRQHASQGPRSSVLNIGPHYLSYLDMDQEAGRCGVLTGGRRSSRGLALLSPGCQAWGGEDEAAGVQLVPGSRKRGPSIRPSLTFPDRSPAASSHQQPHQQPWLQLSAAQSAPGGQPAAERGPVIPWRRGWWCWRLSCRAAAGRRLR